MKELAGRRIVVTGANRGIGAAMAKAFVDAGAYVVVHARSDAEATRIASGAAAAVEGDLRDPELAGRFVGHDVDTLVLNAAIIGEMGRLEEQDPAVFRTVMEVNVDAQLRIYAALLPELLKNKGAVLWMSSGVGRYGVPRYGAYSVSKFAVEGLNALAHAENADAGLVSVAVAPGMVQTDMLRVARGSDDVSAFTPPEVAAAQFVRLVVAVHERGAALAGKSIDVDAF